MVTSKQEGVLNLATTGKPTQRKVNSGKPKLLVQFVEALRSRHYSHRTEQTYAYGVKRFIHYHKIRHPAEMAEAQINAVLPTVKQKFTCYADQSDYC